MREILFYHVGKGRGGKREEERNSLSKRGNFLSPSTPHFTTKKKSIPHIESLVISSGEKMVPNNFANKRWVGHHGIEEKKWGCCGGRFGECGVSEDVGKGGNAPDFLLSLKEKSWEEWGNSLKKNWVVKFFLLSILFYLVGRGRHAVRAFSSLLHLLAGSPCLFLGERGEKTFDCAKRGLDVLF